MSNAQNFVNYLRPETATIAVTMPLRQSGLAAKQAPQACLDQKLTQPHQTLPHELYQWLKAFGLSIVLVSQEELEQSTFLLRGPEELCHGVAS